MNAHAKPRPRTAVLMSDVGMGDLVWHAPYFEQIARTSADDQVTLLVPRSTHAQQLIGHEPWVREVIDFDRRPRHSEQRHGHHRGLPGLRRLADQLAARSLDRIVLFTRKPRSVTLACWWAGIPLRLGYGTEFMQRWLLSRRGWIAPYHGPGVASYWEAVAFCQHHGWCDAPLAPRLTVRPDALARMRERLAQLPRPLHALAIGSSEPFKQWGEAQFAALADTLAAQGHGVLLLGGPVEGELAQAILRDIAPAHRDQVMAITDGTVGETVAAMSLAQACAGNDTGAVQIAAATGTPTFVVLGPRPLLEHDPETLHMLIAPRLQDITPDEVARRLLAVVAAARGQRPDGEEHRPDPLAADACASSP